MPLVVTDRFLLKIFTFVGINVIVVTGLALLFGYAGQVSLGHAAFVGIGAYTCANLTVKLELPWLVAFAASGLVAALGGADTRGPESAAQRSLPGNGDARLR